jgi:hypothetical protein
MFTQYEKMNVCLLLLFALIFKILIRLALVSLSVKNDVMLQHKSQDIGNFGIVFPHYAQLYDDDDVL